MRVLFDTNVLLDVLLDREPWSEDSSAVLTMAERSEIDGTACAISFTTIFYLLRKEFGAATARGEVARLLALLQVAPVGFSTLQRAVEAEVPDFEDAVVVESARIANAEYIVTRDLRGFAASPIPVHTPESFRKLLDLMH